MYKDLTKLLADKKCGNAEIKHFTVSPCDFRAIYIDHMIAGKEYVKLIVDDDIMMSDAPMECASNEWVVNNAHGDVLIAGLGLGLILLPIMEREDVTSVTVVESNQNVIDIVAPQLPINSKVEVLHADIFTYSPSRMFDCIYFDIWPVICKDYAEQMKWLLNKYNAYLKDNSLAWTKCWQEDYVLGRSNEIIC